MADPKPTLRSAQQKKGWRFASKNPAEASLKNIAKAAGVSTGTASRWLRNWRTELGDDLFKAERGDAVVAQTEAARAASEIKWAELREQEARSLGVTASRVRGRLLEILPAVGTVRVDRGESGTQAPMLVSGPSAREIKYLADSAARLFEMAELLEDRPTRHNRRSVPQDQLPPKQIGEEPVDREGREARVLDMVGRLRDKKAAG